MIYEAPTRDQDGCYIVKVKTDENKKCLFQLRNVSVRDLGQEIEMKSSKLDTIKEVDQENLNVATERSKEWFNKELSQETLKTFYTPSFVKNVMTADKISATRVFNPERESIPFEIISEPKSCDVLLEFAGIWFAKKTFGPIWNVVQIKLVKPTPEPEPEPEPEPQEEYPEECIIDDEE